MRSEYIKYINNYNARGFIKDYKDGKYSFVALLPNKDITINDYISSLTGDILMETIKGAKNNPLTAVMPKFSYEYSFVMNEALINMGMDTAFDEDKVDFSKIGKGMDGNLYIGEVLHKTFITVDESGTKAGAVTKVEMNLKSAGPGETVILDRPFVYAIIDNTTDLPLFIGTVVDLS
jgi:serpin B